MSEDEREHEALRHLRDLLDAYAGALVMHDAIFPHEDRARLCSEYLSGGSEVRDNLRYASTIWGNAEKALHTLGRGYRKSRATNG